MTRPAPAVDCVHDASKLRHILERTETLTVVCHRNPDPDAVASALGVQALAVELGVSTTRIAYGGDVSHQENRAMLNVLDVDLTPLQDVEDGALGTVALVDHSSPAQNSPLPSAVTPDIVLDHHDVDAAAGQYVEQQPDIGATATLVTAHLAELSCFPDERVATALYFAIHRETGGFTRGTTPAEHECATYLAPAVDYSTVQELVGTQFTPETIDGIGTAIDSREVNDSCLLSTTGICDERDAIPQAADYLLQIEGISTTVVYGIVDDSIHVSARTSNPLLHVGDVLTTAFDDIGSAGGHEHMAGGQIPLGLFADSVLAEADRSSLIDDAVRTRVFDALGEWAEDETAADESATND